MPAPPTTPHDNHALTVRTISTAVRDFHTRGIPFRIRHGSTNSTRQTSSKGQHFIDTGPLSHILKIDEARKTCLAEPNVPMDKLVKATLAHNLVPLVVMEFPGITVGGGFSGTSAESSSFRHGFFDRTISSVEMVLANGEVVTCSESEDADLFHGAAGAMGTLGVVTLLEVRLKEAKRYVRTSYHAVGSVAGAVETIEELARDPTVDYLDGILFSPSRGAIIAGRATDAQRSEDEPIVTFTRPQDPWFYLHVQNTVFPRPSQTQSKPKISTDTIPLPSYLFRHNRGAFWTASLAFSYFHLPCTRLTRFLLDPLMRTRVLYKAADANPHMAATQYIVQDVGVPMARAAEFVQWSGERLGVWPLWVCPLRPTPHATIDPLPASGPGAADLFLNIGVWGLGPTNRADDFRGLNRDFESKLVEVGGVKCLYAHTFYTEDEFWRIYDRGWYDALRDRYGAASLPSLYDKVKPQPSSQATGLKTRLLGVRPLGGIWGAMKAARYCLSSEHRHVRREGAII